MTIQLALHQSTNDLILKAGGGVERVTDGRYVVQSVRSKLQTQLGEWVLDPSKGWLNFDDFSKQYDLFNIETRARRIILGTTGVKEILEINTFLTKRVLTLQFTATTEYGEINLSVPWSL